MAGAQARLGDISSHGGTIITGSLSVITGGRPVARMGDMHVCPVPGHGVTRIVTGSMSTLADGRPSAGLSDIAGCGAVIVTGSLDVCEN
ncbi:MAG: PAAR domain-containing protein [Armatimonadota bacterium]